MKAGTKRMVVLAGLLVGTGALADGVRARQERQQERVAQGVASGALTAHEALRLERQQVRVSRQVRQDRRDGAGFTPAERARAHARLDAASANIHHQKHDARQR